MPPQTSKKQPTDPVVTVTLNPAIDRVIEVPGLKLGGHLSGRQRSRTPAGKGVNVSRTLAQLGHPSIATGFVGRDRLTEYEADLPVPQVQPQFLGIDGAMRENVTLVDRQTHTETHIRDRGPDVAEADLERMAKKLNLLARADRVMVLAGSLPPGMSVEQFARLVNICRQASARVALDVPGEVLAAVGDGPLWVIKPNLEELSVLLGRPIDDDEQIIAAGRELSRRIHVVMVSRGSAGGYVFVRESALIGQVDLDSRQVVSTVGCGDALLAGFIAAQLEGRDVADSYRYALAVASAAAVQTRPGYVEPADVERFLQQTAVESTG
ncbi:MAG: 1-phosphofructokinase family hexose kinase [Planctomycetes bacterium]|nr:1-phosphofructokinase family hexose kinase [Planctomycetota bacterium]